ncbi:ANTAR domain-containing response regulator [Mesorhizobium sp. B1-1-8]|uniref:ANTAR domain-containing response regulator n=1 Tax=Mesorhizobium sp. B1-1-8 TaxID=2589976 RepID=UPI0011285415|nr:ANTAR domain-containing protein [Mesorhizobium sp. B1-1-8]UCI10538.1 ANTAR domain-containing protein [Mesorhizobium sp. B1-1-8]
MTRTPNFVSWRAAILHRGDDNISRLKRQLERLGVTAQVQWKPLDLAAMPSEIVLVDADQGWDDLLPWEGDDAPVPVVALLGSEAPGRIAWALAKGAGAILAKPIVASSVYPGLVLATHAHRERTAVRARMAGLEERLRLRPIVYDAMRSIVAAQGGDETSAYRTLCRLAMQRRLSIEHVAASILAGHEPVPRAI